MLRSPRLFLDFDQTLFNHHAFADWLDGVFVDSFQTAPGAFTGGFDRYHEMLDNGMRLYHNRAHVEELTGRRWDEMVPRIDEALEQAGRPDFCYEEVHQALGELTAIAADVRVVTFGQEAYQRYKINTCPVVSRLPVHVVSEPKRLFLAREFNDGVGGRLVDDRYPLDLPPGWEHIWIDRENGPAAPHRLDDGTWQVGSLSQVIEIATREGY